MSKKVSVNKPKKSRRRLKRSIRRSLAAVLMITAIAVAAVPVPENFADDGTEFPGGTTENPGGAPSGKLDVHKDLVFDENDIENEVLTDRIDLKKYENASTADLIKALNNQQNRVYASYAITNVDGYYDLSWQFIYYLVTNPQSSAVRAVVCKYNNEYMADEVELNMSPITQYYTLEESKVIAWYEGKKEGLVGMDQSWVPTTEIEYTYRMYVNEQSMSDDAKYFVDNYDKTNFDNKVIEFDNYDPEAGGGEPSSYKVTPSSVLHKPGNTSVTDDMIAYYSHYDMMLKRNTGYRWVKVTDDRITSQTGNLDASGNVSGDVSGNRKTVYVAQHESQAEISGQCDKNGFMIAEGGTAVNICAIGNKAFEGASRVKTLTIPSAISYIGDEAFKNATLVTTINIGNVEHLGNRAFSGCSHLSSVTFGTGLKVIGAECFKNTALTKIALPDTVTTIGEAAFAGCRQLAELDLSACNGLNAGCEIKDFAFYNCIALNDIKLNGTNEMIISIGEGAFALPSGGNPISVTMPGSTQSIGDYMFSGRATLKSVVFPKQYGTGTGARVSLPDNMFHGCANLEFVEFPVDSNNLYVGGYVNYSPKTLFADVSNPDFYVRGPELKNLTDVADPREDTWDAITWVHDYIPYVFKNAQGIDCYEVAIDGYRYQANEKKELTSCVLINKQTEGNLVIPKSVGKYDIESIVPGCFGTGPNYTDEAMELRNSIKTITIADESISSIGDRVFENLPKLTKVTIGNSVTSIGAGAFEGCDLLTEVVFHSPLGGHESFPESNIGHNAFATGGTNLTFNGDIADNYGPYAWAMNPDNKLNEVSGMRVCYKSLSPNFLTVIYDPNTKLRTLIDYPKFDQVDSLLEELHKEECKRNGYASYKAMMAARYYATYASSDFDDSRRAFRDAWNAAGDSAVERTKVYESDVYGPWVNEYFVANYASGSNSGMDAPIIENPEPENPQPENPNPENPEPENPNPENPEPENPEPENPEPENPEQTGGGSDTASNMFDWLFEPIVANASEGGNNSAPLAYYTRYPYSAQENSDNNRGLTSEEAELIIATKNLVVPSGIDSIDVYAYRNGRQDPDFNNSSELINQNRTNARTYLSATRIGDASYHMYLDEYSDDSDYVSGLFSGSYTDSCEEMLVRGNDRVEQITLTDVTYLPDYAFDSCERLQFVDLGAKCSDIGTAPFRGCNSLITVKGNEYYTEDNGIIYSVKPDGSYKIEECLATRGNKKGQPTISVLTDPNIAKVSEIQDGAFEDCVDITSIDLNGAAALTEIPEKCFMGCNDLDNVYLPDTVNNIKKDAFKFDDPSKGIYVEIPGVEVQIATDSFDPKGPKVRIGTYEDTSAYRFAKYYDITLVILDNVWNVTFFDIDGTMLGETKVPDGQVIPKDKRPADPERAGLTFKGWKGSIGSEIIEIDDAITGRATFLAQYDTNEGMVNGKFVVEFYTAFGDKLGDTLYIEPGGSITADQIPEPRVYEGYKFKQWTPSTFTNIQKATTYIAGYDPVSGTTNTSGNSTNTSGNSTNNTSKSSTSTSSSSTSTSATSTSSSATGKYTVTVVGGSGSGTYDVGSTVIIAANTPATGKVFSKWTTESQGVTLASVSMTATTFIMPANNVTVTANYVDGTAVNTIGGTVNNGNTGNLNTGNRNGATTVDITKPGISNKDLATANVNGSSDNFVVKISETDEATQAVINALINKYGNIDSILYYAMDISLYDSTGTVKITDTSGLSVDITIPIPDALTVFGGNNMAGAVVSNQLEDLSERFTTINGIPCISFTATHFSPYTIYVNTQNLSEGMLDVTPKTGDPIHPKWFLSLGLACLSIILFMKKDRKPAKVKAA